MYLRLLLHLNTNSYQNYYQIPIPKESTFGKITKTKIHLS